MTTLISKIIKRRTEIESEIIHFKRKYSPQQNDSRSDIETKITSMERFKSELLTQVQNLKLEIEEIEKTNSNINKSSLTRVYSDLKLLESNVSKMAISTYNNLRLRIQQIDLTSNSNFSVQMDEEQSSHYGRLKEQDDLVSQGNRKADSALEMGKDVLSMFNSQNQRIRRIFGNLKEIGSDARYSE